MKNSVITLIIILFLFSCKKEVTDSDSQEVKAAWSASGRWDSWSNGGYTVYNNIWGSGAGAQNIWANSYSNWGIWANHPNTSGIKSYPNSTRYIGRALGSVNTLSSSINATTPSGGAWTTAFDIWDNNKQHEIMLWLNYTSNSDGSGNIKPISYNWNAQGNPIPVYTNVNVGGASWNVFRGHNGGNNVYSFLRRTKTNNTTIDVKAIMNWVRARGWFGNITVGDVQFGYEITSCYGNNGSGSNFTTNSYNVTFN